MSKGRPRKYRTKKESKLAKKTHTKLFVTFTFCANGSWYERVKVKRLCQPTGPLNALKLEVAESMHRKLENKNLHQMKRGRTLLPHPQS
jgi:hypothetical protein